MTQSKNNSALFPFGSSDFEKSSVPAKKPLRSGWVYMDSDMKDRLPLGWDQDNVSTQIGILWALNQDVLSKRMKIVDLRDSTFVQRLELLKFMYGVLGLKFEQDAPPELNG